MVTPPVALGSLREIFDVVAEQQNVGLGKELVPVGGPQGVPVNRHNGAPSPPTIGTAGGTILKEGRKSDDTEAGRV